MQPPKFNIGNNLCIRKKKAMFEKGYVPSWTEEIFKIYKVQMKRPVIYKLEHVDEKTAPFMRLSCSRLNERILGLRRYLEEIRRRLRLW